MNDARVVPVPKTSGVVVETVFEEGDVRSPNVWDVRMGGDCNSRRC